VAEQTKAQQQRAQARERRRSRAKPSEADRSDAAVDESADNQDQPLEAVKHAAKVAAAGAAVGAAAAAARALTSRDGDDDEESGPQAEADIGPQAEQDQKQDEQDQKQEQGQQEQEDQQPEAETDDAPADELPDPVSVRREDGDVRGATPDDARTTVQRARDQLEALLERSVESVSSLERTNDGWLVTLEVVEVSRIPESTDVLASYQMELDEDRNLRRYARVRRYHRTAAERGEQQ
jgi:Gas vesicle synthesis protein GvpO